MTLLTAVDILGSEDLVSEEVEVPEWPDSKGQPGRIRLRQLNAEESMRLTEEMLLKENEKAGMFIMLVRCAVNEDGSRVFTEEDIPALKKKSFRVLERLQRVALRLQSMDKQSEVALKNVSSEAASVASHSS